MRTAAVVVAWRQAGTTAAALRSLLAMQPPPDAVVCVAQEMGPAGLEALAAVDATRLRLIALEENVGFAAACNRGVEAAMVDGASWVLLLNNDATVRPKCLARCLEDGLEHARTAATGPAIVFADDPTRLWYAGGQQHPWLAFTRHRGLNRGASRLPAGGLVDYVTGCCALVNAEAWRELGGFREEYFLYYEDVEWCARARAAGWECRFVAEVLCEHAVGVSAGRRGSLGLSDVQAYYLARNPLRYAMDRPTAWARVRAVAGIMTVWTAYNGWRLLQAHRLTAYAAYGAGIADAVRGRMGRWRAQSATAEGEVATA